MNLPSEVLQAAFRSVPLEVAILDADGDICYTNQQWQDFAIENGLVGDPGTIGENYLAAIDDRDPCTAEIHETISSVLEGRQERAQVEYPCHSPDQQRWFLMYARSFEADGARYVQIGHLDITERKLAELDVQASNERLSAVASILGHDLRSPLNVAMGRLESLSGDPEHLDALRRALDRIDEIVEDALVLSRQAGPEELQSVDLADAAYAAWETLETPDATLQVEESLTFAADQGLLANCLVNLFRNAEEHAGEDVTVTVGALEDGFYVEDDGVGIPAADREQIFETGFTTGDSAVHTGLGLLIVQAVCRAHGWRVDVTDSATGGARFEIRGLGMPEE